MYSSYIKGGWVVDSSNRTTTYVPQLAAVNYNDFCACFALRVLRLLSIFLIARLFGRAEAFLYSVLYYVQRQHSYPHVVQQDDVVPMFHVLPRVHILVG